MALGLEFEEEFVIPVSRTRGDFLVRNTIIECKVSAEAGALNEALGQAIIYRTFTPHHVIILLPDDLPDRAAWSCAAKSIGVEIMWERQLPEIVEQLKRRENACFTHVA